MDREKDTISILANMRRSKDDVMDRLRQSTFFLALTFLAGTVILVYLGALLVLSLVAIFMLIISIMMYLIYKQTKDDIKNIDDFYLEYTYEAGKKKKN